MLRVESKLKRLLRKAMGRDGNITELSEMLRIMWSVSKVSMECVLARSLIVLGMP